MQLLTVMTDHYIGEDVQNFTADNIVDITIGGNDLVLSLEQVLRWKRNYC